jgi:hypothetical protein
MEEFLKLPGNEVYDKLPAMILYGEPVHKLYLHFSDHIFVPAPVPASEVA